jgi:hypothetical protein
MDVSDHHPGLPFVRLATKGRCPPKGDERARQDIFWPPALAADADFFLPGVFVKVHNTNPRNPARSRGVLEKEFIQIN